MIEAEYEDGYVHREDEQDISPYKKDKNIFYDILHKLPEKAHGKMVRFTCYGPENTYTIDWTTLPANARPIRYIDKEKDLVLGGDGSVQDEGETRITAIRFGYQFTDKNGKNIKEIQEVK